MIIDIFLLLLLMYLLYFKNTINHEKFDIKKNDLVTLENKDIISYPNIIIKPNIKLNDYSIEVDRPIFSCSNYMNDKILDFTNIDNQLITNVYDKFVDDNRKQIIDYNKLTNIDKYEYYDIKNNDNYGYTNFMTYKK
jgi:hypothetical protein